MTFGAEVSPKRPSVRKGNAEDLHPHEAIKRTAHRITTRWIRVRKEMEAFFKGQVGKPITCAIYAS